MPIIVYIANRKVDTYIETNFAESSERWLDKIENTFRDLTTLKEHKSTFIPEYGLESGENFFSKK